MANTILATFENGLLKPSKQLPLQEHQQVLLIIVPLTAEGTQPPNLSRVVTLRAQASHWLSQQSPETVREPLTLSAATDRQLDDEFSQALAAIRAEASRFDEQQILADVEAAITEVRSLSDDERSRLDAEINDVLAQVAFYATC